MRAIRPYWISAQNIGFSPNHETSELAVLLCKRILESSITDDMGYKLHHQKLDSFQKAILQGCYFCSTMWKGFALKLRDALMRDDSAWRPMYYLATRERTENGLVSLSISYQDPSNGYATKTRFRMSTADDDKYGPMFQSPYLEATTSLSLTLDTIQDWYLSCRESHSSCVGLAKSEPWSPSRLIYIGAQGETEWDLQLRSGDQSPPPAYATPSYRWGCNHDFMLTEKTLNAGFYGRLEDLPRTFKQFQ